MKQTATLLSRFEQWVTDYFLLLMAGFLLAFIPLYPKIPIWSPIEQYIVRVRMEDLVVFFTFAIWCVQVLRKKIAWHTSFGWFIALYVIVGGLSVLSAMFVTQSFPLQMIHIGKTLLHYFRYIEYFSLFFIVSTAVKTKKQVALLLGVLTLTVVGIAVYGYGQKFFYWPVYSTMNREFSKGARLVLSENARVQSTFGGHYDLGAYLVVVLPLILSLAYASQKKWLSGVLHVAHWMGVWILIMSASRTSFLAYLVGMMLVIGLQSLQLKTWGERIRQVASRSIIMYALIGVTMLRYGNDMYERFLTVLRAYPSVNMGYHRLNGARIYLFDDYLPRTLGFKKISMPKPELPEGAILVDTINDVAVPVNTAEKPVTPGDVNVGQPETILVATVSSTGATVYTQVQKNPEFSENAFKYGLSLAIRLDTLWPQALRGFMKNPVVGYGYGTLNKEAASDFKEADSTDNNFLRTLGETGLLGFITFYGSILASLILAWKSIHDSDRLLRVVSIGYLSGTLGLLLNAVYIDVFAASKVAFTFWALTGLFVALYWIVHRSDPYAWLQKLASKLPIIKKYSTTK